MKTTKRQAFKSIDANRNLQQSPAGGKSKGVAATSCSKPITSSGKSERTVVSAKSQVLHEVDPPPSLSPTKRHPTATEPKATFDQVCELRVAEDSTGDLAELGIRPWSFEDFDYLRKLGSGACATVYAARERKSGHTVALKIQDADAGECYFDDEVDIHYPLEHPRIVNMVDYFYSDVPFVDPPSDTQDDLDDSSSSTMLCSRYLCMILELCDGKDLYDTMRATANKRLDEARAATYFKSALDSLDYIHAAEIIHCDVKPSNFMVHGDELKLADFGMAVRNEEREVIGGSPVYMSPEHVVAWRTDNDEFDHRVDIYSLGVVLYEILIGQLPYEVIEDAEDLADYILLSGMGRINIGGDNRLQPPVLDLRKLNDFNADEDEKFEFPAPKFPAFVSEEAKDLILRLMEPCAEKRITIASAKKHLWLQKF